MTHFKGRHCEWMPSRWGNGWDHTINALRNELIRNKITDAVIETYHSRSDYTVSGRPKSGSQPNNPSVQIWFKIGDDPVCIPCSRFKDWSENLKAIQMSIRSKRLEREYGCSTIEEQYRGHAQLPAGGSGITHAGEGVFASARLILNVSKNTSLKVEDVLDDEGVFDEIFKSASKHTHPDKGGSQELMAAVNNARSSIRSAKGW